MALNKDDKDFIKLSLEPIHVEVKGIKEHLGKINGHVQDHEKAINAAIADRDSYRVHWNNKIDDLDEIKEKVDSIDKSLLEYKVIKKYPKLFVVMSAVFVLWMGWELLQHFVI